MYVYKITNNINNKIYIGITNNYKKRWDNEKSYPKNPERRQVIQEAIHKYGKNNFLNTTDYFFHISCLNVHTFIFHISNQQYQNSLLCSSNQ